MKSKILEILRNKDTYVSGQELSERFGVSRTAVWKAIHQLEEEGYRIEAVPRKGYHMVETPDVVCKEEILSLLETKDLYDNNALAKELFDKADEILGFKITDIMFAGTDDQLKETKVIPLQDSSTGIPFLKPKSDNSFSIVHFAAPSLSI